VEHSGTAPTALANTNTGVFIGLSTHDNLGMASDELTYAEIEAYTAIGTSSAAAAGRISNRLGLQGPAVAVDTACSSSLVAIHQACQALRLGKCHLALAGRREAPYTEMLPLCNRSEMLHSPMAVAGGSAPGEFANLVRGVCCERPLTWFGEATAPASEHWPGGIESSPAEARRTTAWHPSKV
jgi:acyl transferase domain-containing protein